VGAGFKLQMLYHLKELVELSRMPSKLALGKIFEPRYRRLKIEKP